jgi:hypothetical protein
LTPSPAPELSAAESSIIRLESAAISWIVCAISADCWLSSVEVCAIWIEDADISSELAVRSSAMSAVSEAVLLIATVRLRRPPIMALVARPSRPISSSAAEGRRRTERLPAATDSAAAASSAAGIAIRRRMNEFTAAIAPRSRRKSVSPAMPRARLDFRSSVREMDSRECATTRQVLRLVVRTEARCTEPSL